MNATPLVRLLLALTAATMFSLPVACRRAAAPQAATTPEAAIAPAAPSEEPMVFELRVADKAFEKRLVRGFYEVGDGWRWTARSFALSLDVPPPVDAPTEVEMDFAVPPELMKDVPKTTLTMRVNGREVGKAAYNSEGQRTVKFAVPAEALRPAPVLVEGALDHWTKDPENGREIGLIVVRVELRHRDGQVLDHDSATALARTAYLQAVKQRQAAMSIEKQNELMKLFHELPVWRSMWFHNVQIGKNPLDLWMMQQIFYETQPEFVVETGTLQGGSALYWASALEAMGLENSKVITVDIEDLHATASQHRLWKKYVTAILGSSTDPAVVKQITDLVRGHKTVVSLDSDHSMQHVLNELHAYAGMVNRGSYLVVEDTHMDGVPTYPQFGPGPMAAVRKFLTEPQGKAFAQDISREAMIMTFNPGGWLRRK